MIFVSYNSFCSTTLQFSLCHPITNSTSKNLVHNFFSSFGSLAEMPNSNIWFVIIYGNGGFRFSTISWQLTNSTVEGLTSVSRKDVTLVKLNRETVAPSNKASTHVQIEESNVQEITRSTLKGIFFLLCFPK